MNRVLVQGLTVGYRGSGGLDEGSWGLRALACNLGPMSCQNMKDLTAKPVVLS